MDQPMFVTEQQTAANHVSPAERPLPPTPADDGDSIAEQQGRGKTVMQPSDGNEEYEPDEGSEQTPVEERRATRREWRNRRMTERQKHDMEREHNTAAEMQISAGGGMFQAPQPLGAGSSANIEGGDLRALDIYGSSGEEGTGHRDAALRAVEGTDSSTGNRGPTTPRRNSARSARHHSIYTGDAHQDGSSSGGDSPLLSHTSPSQIRRRPSTRTEVVIPRWQPDAEVTFCPICRTQFSFFVRKHHCRKCGRVVCNSCSPHRITIPYQYIVQPPTEGVSSTARTSVDTARVGSSTVVASLGGGERVRLCNPCVPDPNIAPPQTRSESQPPQQHGHSRSASSAAVPYSQSGRATFNSRNLQPQPRQPSIPGTPAFQAQNRAWVTSINSAQQRASGSYSGRDESAFRPDGLESRSRSSTVGSTREGPNMGINTSRPSADLASGPYSRLYQNLVPRSEVNLSRPLPHTPQSQPQHTRRRRIPEEDECWVCHQELPSRTLPNFEDLRQAHTAACVQTAMEGPHRSTPQNNVSISVSASGHITRNRHLSSAAAEASSSSSTIPNTPEARMAAREREHAAVVLGRPHIASGSSSSLSRVIPYTASEKDCVDDAECTICLEEFEVSQQMGRLECFCRFHMKCIQGWFEQKPGKCPVHGVDN